MVQSRVGAFGEFLPTEKHHHYFDNKTQLSPFLQWVSPSTQPLDSRMPVPLVLGQVPGGVTFEAGLSQQQSELIIGEGLTIFSNHVPSHFLSDDDVQASGIDKKKSWEARSLRHLELEINAFLEEMPIKPHTDRHYCPHPNFDILACSSKCFRKSDGTVSRIGGLLYFWDVCSFFMSWQDIGDVIQLHIKNKINDLPIELKVVLPHVTDLLKSRWGGGIFSCPPHANKCMYFSILVDRINLVSRVHELTLPRHVELCSIVLALNGMDLPWSILTG
jgi:hypothetical protein